MIAVPLTVNLLACLVCSWVAGCLLLSMPRPASFVDLVQALGLLGVCVYGLAEGIAPLRWTAPPSAFGLGWRVSIACVAAVVYSRRFGWSVVWCVLASLPAAAKRWAQPYIDAGKTDDRRPR